MNKMPSNKASFVVFGNFAKFVKTTNPSYLNDSFSRRRGKSESANNARPINTPAIINTNEGRNAAFRRKTIVKMNTEAWNTPQRTKFIVTPCHIAEARYTTNIAGNVPKERFVGV